jgi:hypothetical protein
MATQWNIALENPPADIPRIIASGVEFPVEPALGDIIILSDFDPPIEGDAGGFLVTRRIIGSGNRVLAVDPYREGQKPTAGPLRDLIE